MDEEKERSLIVPGLRKAFDFLTPLFNAYCCVRIEAPPIDPEFDKLFRAENPGEDPFIDVYITSGNSREECFLHPHPDHVIFAYTAGVFLHHIVNRELKKRFKHASEMHSRLYRKHATEIDTDIAAEYEPILALSRIVGGLCMFAYAEHTGSCSPLARHQDALERMRFDAMGQTDELGRIKGELNVGMIQYEQQTDTIAQYLYSSRGKKSIAELAYLDPDRGREYVLQHAGMDIAFTRPKLGIIDPGHVV